MNKIALGSDHAGLDFKNKIKKYLEENKYIVDDVGTHTHDSVHYPDYAKKACDQVIKGKCDKAILICGTGVGISIAANKINGIRAVVCSDSYSSRMARAHNDSNVLALGSRVVGLELAKDIINIWLNTEFEGDRHLSRLELIEKLEQS